MFQILSSHQVADRECRRQSLHAQYFGNVFVDAFLLRSVGRAPETRNVFRVTPPDIAQLLEHTLQDHFARRLVCIGLPRTQRSNGKNAVGLLTYTNSREMTIRTHKLDEVIPNPFDVVIAEAATFRAQAEHLQKEASPRSFPKSSIHVLRV